MNDFFLIQWLDNKMIIKEINEIQRNKNKTG